MPQGGICGVMINVVGNGHGDTSSHPGWGISHRTNTLGKGMNPVILSSVYEQIAGQTEFFNLGQATGLGEGKLLVRTC